ncbi:sensor histidine kinase [Litoreibacter roseus]|uniref:histidine kinase n=1 Tax=Litoreibacter roseus TaxID=2601869 RepID=A0A6N6JF13_9RHOB|nr:sensor histidine kinase [Litoreibacter roseus]GFE63959.1 hypothetical protein KIN_10330 [Litoreibacter roseus]
MDETFELERGRVETTEPLQPTGIAASALDAGHIGLMTIAADTYEIEVSTQAARILNLGSETKLSLENFLRRCVYTNDRPETDRALRSLSDPEGVGQCQIEFRLEDEEGEFLWIEVVLKTFFDVGTSPRAALRADGIVRDITEDVTRRDGLERRIENQNHWIKNMFAVVQGIAYQSFRPLDAATNALSDFQGRLKTLSSTHDLLAGGVFRGVFLNDLIRGVVTSCGGSNDQVAISGYPMRMNSKQAIAMSMILRELVSNSIRHGAMSVPEGTVHAFWQRNASSELITFVWREADGPEVTEPKEEGTGVRLMSRICAIEFGGIVNFDFDPDGVAVSMKFSNRSLKEIDI